MLALIVVRTNSIKYTDRVCVPMGHKAASSCRGLAAFGYDMEGPLGPCPFTHKEPLRNTKTTKNHLEPQKITKKH